MKLARTQNTIRNTLWGAVYRLVTLFGPFVVKTILIKQLGLEYAGLNGLFTSILTVLNLANLGFSSALVFTMYKAVVDDDKDALCAMLNFFRKVYRIVGFAILGIGLCLMPFMNVLVKGECPPDINIHTLFGIYLFETCLGYLMFAYTLAVFSAYQRTDVSLKIDTVRYLIQYALQAAVLLIFKNYYIYALMLPLMIIPNNIANYVISRKMYPDILCRGKLDKDIKKGIYGRVWTLFGHKVGSTFLTNISNLMISAFLGLVPMSLYNNYYYILTAVNGVVEIITNGSLAGIGNKLITDTKDENYKLFNTLNYGWITLIGAAACCMLCFYQPFIQAIWLGEEYLLDDKIMILIVAFFFSWMFRIMQLTYRDAAGLWTKDWLKPYVGTTINILGGIILVNLTDSIAGVLIPTIFVFLFVYFPWEAWAIFKFQFNKSLKEYFLKVAGYVILCVLCCGTAYGLCMLITPENTILSLVIRVAIVGITYPAIWILFTFKTFEFKNLISFVKRQLLKRV